LLPSDNLLLNAPQIVNKRQRRLKGIDEIVLSLTAKGLTTEEVAAYFKDIYGEGSNRSRSTPGPSSLTSVIQR
jgi:transposase-like protein